ncbi:MAG TPA: hypothetical protein VN176_14030 [Verrucomicrobiae bacterium]|jgi:F0F1-type ATP synthase membrane subunit b/b'|nr:hypothetical protein [Verrucomicrobiae bacterium]
MFNRKFWTTGVFAVLLAGLLTFGWTTPVQALDRDHNEKCEKRVHKAEEQLEKAVHRHGEHSRQAEQKRHQLEEAREKCHHDGDRDHDHH